MLGWLLRCIDIAGVFMAAVSKVWKFVHIAGVCASEKCTGVGRV